MQFILKCIKKIRWMNRIPGWRDRYAIKSTADGHGRIRWGFSVKFFFTFCMLKCFILKCWRLAERFTGGRPMRIRLGR